VTEFASCFPPDWKITYLTGPRLTFTVYGDAKPAGSKRAFVHNGRAIVTDANKNSKPWKQEVASVGAIAMERAGLPLFTCALRVTFRIVVPRPAGHYGKRGLLASARPHPSVKPDVLKLARGIEDSLSGICWHDDALIVDEHITKEYGEPARVEITVAPMPPMRDTHPPAPEAPPPGKD
jgi:Holliday junction resolvase RusA-like endonuclease